MPLALSGAAPGLASARFIRSQASRVAHRRGRDPCLHVRQLGELLDRLTVLHEQTRRFVLSRVWFVGHQNVVGHEQDIPVQLAQAANESRVDVPLDGGEIHGAQA